MHVAPFTIHVALSVEHITIIYTDTSNLKTYISLPRRLQSHCILGFIYAIVYIRLSRIYYAGAYGLPASQF